MTILNIITNESVSKKDEKYSCDNIDLKSIPESLDKYTQVNLIGRKSKIQRNKEINISNFSIHGNIFSYLLSIIRKTEKQKDKYSIKAEIWEWEEIISTDKLRDEDMLRCVREYNKQMSYWKKRDENIRQGKMKYGLSHHASQIENDLNWMKLEIQNIPRDFITIKALFVFETKEQLVTVVAYCR